MFITLALENIHGETTPCRVNVAHIVYYGVNDEGPTAATEVVLTADSFHVRETPEEIDKLIFDAENPTYTYFVGTTDDLMIESGPR